jgi:hypothetical protein
MPELPFVIPGRPLEPGPGPISPVCDCGFRVCWHSASKTRVNALMGLAPRNDGDLR